MSTEQQLAFDPQQDIPEPPPSGVRLIPEPPEAPSTNLPVPLTSFIGRQAEIAALDRLLARDGVRLITLVGPAGCGKTRLAGEWLRRELPARLAEQPGGIWHCDLTAARSAEGICAAVGAALGVPLGAGTTATDSAGRIRAALGARGPALLVLDSFEHLAGWAEPTIGRWLQETEATFIVTSRARLGLRDEHVFSLGPLGLPAADGRAAPAAADAVRLFVERARQVRHGYELTPFDAPKVADIVRRLDGMPLCIELAAARMHVLSAAQIAQHLEHRFQLLVNRRAGAAPRHATLRGALDWSFQLLSITEQAALAQCAVFRGSFELQAAERVIELPEPAEWILDVLQSLCEQSLIRAEELPDGRGIRYRLYESVREHARERLDEATRLAAQERHDEHYAAFAQGAREHIHGPARRAVLAELATEEENLLAVLQRAVSASDDPRAAARGLTIATALAPLLLAQGPLSRLLQLLDVALAGAERQPAAARSLVAEARLARAEVLTQLGRSAEAAAEQRLALALAEACADHRLEGRVLARLACHTGGDLRRTYRLQEQALALHRAAFDRSFEGRTLSQQGNTLYLQGDSAAARAAHQQALTILQDNGDPQSEALAHGNLGRLEHDLGRLDAARRHYKRAMQLLGGVGDYNGLANVAMNLGSVALEQGELSDARRLYEKALCTLRRIGGRRLLGFALALLGQTWEIARRPDEARECYEEALELLRQHGEPRILGLTYCCLGRLQADQDQIAAAERSLRRGQQILAGLGPSFERGLPELCEAHVLLAYARSAHAQGRVSDMRHHLAAASRAVSQIEGASAAGTATGLRSSDARLALARLKAAIATSAPRASQPPPRPDEEEERPGLQVSTTGHQVELPDGRRIDLSTRGAPRRILKALSDLRMACPGASLSLAELLAAGWPGESPVAHAGANRVYAAIATLRKLGLKPFLLRRDDGYLIDPALPVCRT